MASKIIHKKPVGAIKKPTDTYSATLKHPTSNQTSKVSSTYERVLQKEFEHVNNHNRQLGFEAGPSSKPHHSGSSNCFNQTQKSSSSSTVYDQSNHNNHQKLQSKPEYKNPAMLPDNNIALTHDNLFMKTYQPSGPERRTQSSITITKPYLGHADVGGFTATLKSLNANEDLRSSLSPKVAEKHHTVKYSMPADLSELSKNYLMNSGVENQQLHRLSISNNDSYGYVNFKHPVNTQSYNFMPTYYNQGILHSNGSGSNSYDFNYLNDNKFNNNVCNISIYNKSNTGKGVTSSTSTAHNSNYTNNSDMSHKTHLNNTDNNDNNHGGNFSNGSGNSLNSNNSYVNINTSFVNSASGYITSNINFMNTMDSYVNTNGSSINSSNSNNSVSNGGKYQSGTSSTAAQSLFRNKMPKSNTINSERGHSYNPLFSNLSNSGDFDSQQKYNAINIPKFYCGDQNLLSNNNDHDNINTHNSDSNNTETLKAVSYLDGGNPKYSNLTISPSIDTTETKTGAAFPKGSFSISHSSNTNTNSQIYNLTHSSGAQGYPLSNNSNLYKDMSNISDVTPTSTSVSSESIGETVKASASAFGNYNQNHKHNRKRNIPLINAIKMDEKNSKKVSSISNSFQESQEELQTNFSRAGQMNLNPKFLTPVSSDLPKEHQNPGLNRPEHHKPSTSTSRSSSCSANSSSSSSLSSNILGNFKDLMNFDPHSSNTYFKNTQDQGKKSSLKDYQKTDLPKMEDSASNIKVNQFLTHIAHINFTDTNNRPENSPVYHEDSACRTSLQAIPEIRSVIVKGRKSPIPNPTSAPKTANTQKTTSTANSPNTPSTTNSKSPAKTNRGRYYPNYANTYTVSTTSNYNNGHTKNQNKQQASQMTESERNSSPHYQKRLNRSSSVHTSSTNNNNSNNAKSKKSEFLNSLKDFSFSFMNTTKNFLMTKFGPNNPNRLKCHCSPNLGDEESCPFAIEWLLMTYNENELEYLHSTFQTISSLKDVDPKSKKQISLDISRTYPASKMFGADSKDLQSLQKVLDCIAKYDPQIGYVQGMNFLAAAFLYHAEEYMAFWLFIMIFEKFEMRDIYLPNLPGLAKHSQIIDFLILNNLPQLYSHFCKNNIVVEMFCTEWICALFGSIIPLEKMVLFLDEFIREGWPFFYKMVLAILKYFEKPLYEAQDMSDIMLIFKYNINNNHKQFPDMKYIEIKWDKLIKSAKEIELDTVFVHSLLTKFDQETKRFNFNAK